MFNFRKNLADRFNPIRLIDLPELVTDSVFGDKVIKRVGCPDRPDDLGKLFFRAVCKKNRTGLGACDVHMTDAV